MKHITHVSIFLILIISTLCQGQQPGFRKLYSGDITGAAFTDILFDGQKLITAGQFLTDTAPNGALNGQLYMEMDTNGNTLFTDIYFHPNDAMTSQIGNNIYKSNNGFIYAMDQILDATSSSLSIYNEMGRVSTVVIPVDGLQSWLYHCVDWNDNILLSGRRQNYQYDSEGMLIKSDPMGKEIWRRYYGKAGLDCGIGEPFILGDNIILLPGNKSYWPDSAPIINKWTKTWIVAVDSLGKVKWEWESEKNKESGIATRLQRLPNKDWLYITSEFIPMPGQIDNFGFSPKIVCRDSNFNLVWERNLPAYPTTACYMVDLQPTSDGNFIAVGFWNDDEWWGADVVHKFAPNGDSIWTYRDYCEPFFGCYHYLGGIAELPSGSIVAAGYYENIDEAKSYGLLIKLGKNGCMDTLCSGMNGVYGVYETELANKIKVYPNPTSSIINIENPIGEKVELFDVTGRNVKEVKVSGDRQVFDIQEFPTGTYLLKMREKNLHVTYKIIKQ